MSRRDTVECKSCGRWMTPRVIYGRRFGGFSSRSSVQGSCCPFCLSDCWEGDKGVIEMMVHMVSERPWVLILLIFSLPVIAIFLLGVVAVIFVSSCLLIDLLMGRPIDIWIELLHAAMWPVGFGMR